MRYQVQKLRRVSDTIYEEATLPTDRTRPLEWRRDLNEVTFRVAHLRALTTHSVNECDAEFNPEKETDELAQLKPSADTIYSVTGIVNNEKTRDRIYCLVKTYEENIFTTERPPGQMKVLLRGGLAIKDHHRVRDGVFMGTLLRADSEPKRDYLCLEATISVGQAKSLHLAIKENPNLELDVSALVRSFSYEVDDKLREWYHPRDLLVRESTPAAISWIRMPSDHEEEENEEAQEVAELDDDTGKSESYALPPEMQAQVAGVQLLSTISKDIALMATTVKRISLALWLGLAVIVLVIVF